MYDNLHSAAPNYNTEKNGKVLLSCSQPDPKSQPIQGHPEMNHVARDVTLLSQTPNASSAEKTMAGQHTDYKLIPLKNPTHYL